MNVISRGFERNAIRVVAFWQLISGIYTTFRYAPYLKVNGVLAVSDSKFDGISAEIFANNLFLVAVTIGMLFIVMGSVNLMLVKKIKDDCIEKKLAWWFLGCAFICFCMMDIISCSLLFIGSIFMLSKNKAIKLKTELTLLHK